jgi:biopolymer transport protein ExbB
LPNGQYTSAHTLSIGPNNWFLQTQLKQSGMLGQDNEVSIFFDEAQTKQLQTLFSDSKATITVDPSLGAAIKLEKRKETAIQHLQRGGIWAVPIVLFGLFALLIGLAKTFQLLRLPKLDPMLAERIEMIVRDNNAREHLGKIRSCLRGAQQDIVNIALETTRGEQRDNKLLAYLLSYRQKLQSSLGAIAITASVAPLLGLLGTVSGMIETFNMMNLFGSGDPSVVSGGISKALITTELGLIVAIPALVLHALLNRAIRNHHTQLDSTAIRLGEVGEQTT